MNIPFIAVAFYVLLIGIPALSGTYILVSSYGRQKSSSGLALLIYSIVVGGFMTYLMPEGKFSGGNSFIVFPLVLFVAITIGAISGVIARRNDK